MPIAYFLLVLIYVLRKNVDRWFEKNWKKRKGELYLVGWWLAMLVMYVIEFKTNGQYHVPPKMIETCILVLLPYGANAVSKHMHKHRRKPNCSRQLIRVKVRSIS
jgi:hypothetical protein